MKSVYELSQQALDSIFYGIINVCAEELITDELLIPDEYITFNSVSAYYSEYANGVPIQRTESVDVKYYCRSLDGSGQRLDEIERAMVDAGFLIVSLPRSLGKDQDTGHIGFAIECSIARTVNNNG